MSGRAGLSHVYATVRDLAAAKAFWTEMIGLEVVVDGDEYTRLGGGGGFTMGMERAGGDAAPELEVVVRVYDVDAAYERLVAGGVECSGPPQDMPWGARHIWLRDPDGHLVSLYSAPDTDTK